MKFQCWRDTKKSVRTKYTKIQQWNSTSGNPPCAIILTPMENKLVNIMGQQALDGIPLATEVGLPKRICYGKQSKGI